MWIGFAWCKFIYGVINASFCLTSFTQHYACENYSDYVHCDILLIYLLHSILFYKIVYYIFIYLLKDSAECVGWYYTVILVSIFSMFNGRIIFYYIYWTIVYLFIVDLWVSQNLDISVSWVNVLEISSPIPCLASLLINDIFRWSLHFNVVQFRVLLLFMVTVL